MVYWCVIGSNSNSREKLHKNSEAPNLHNIVHLFGVVPSYKLITAILRSAEKMLFHDYRTSSLFLNIMGF